MWGEGEEQVQLVLRLGMFLARVPLLLYESTQRVYAGAKRSEKPFISRSITFKTGGINITPVDRNQMRIVIKDSACIGLHDLPATACSNSIQEAVKLMNYQTALPTKKSHDPVNQQVLTI